MRIKPATAFAALNNVRAEKRNLEKVYIVRRLNKDGSPDRSTMKKLDWQLNAFINRADAEKRAEDLGRMNPGTKYAIARKTALGWFLIGTEVRIAI